jgi:hypothetical protein
MCANPTFDVPGVSPAKARALFLGALAAALLGLTLVDVAPLATRAVAVDPQSIDAIVAEAVFAGVGASQSAP